MPGPDDYALRSMRSSTPGLRNPLMRPRERIERGSLLAAIITVHLLLLLWLVTRPPSVRPDPDRGRGLTLISLSAGANAATPTTKTKPPPPTVIPVRDLSSAIAARLPDVGRCGDAVERRVAGKCSGIGRYAGNAVASSGSRAGNRRCVARLSRSAHRRSAVSCDPRAGSHDDTCNRIRGVALVRPSSALRGLPWECARLLFAPVYKSLIDQLS
jgi:hypothetical protein